LAVIAMLLNTFNLGFQAVVLSQSLDSLAAQKNGASVSQTIDIEFFSIVVLVWTVVIVSSINYKRAKTNETKGNISGKTNPAADKEDDV
jgi:hypothetical protein